MWDYIKSIPSKLGLKKLTPVWNYVKTLPARMIRLVFSILFISINLIVSIPLVFLYHEDYVRYMGKKYEDYTNSITEYTGKRWFWQ